MRVEFHPAAAGDLLAAAVFYERHAENLGAAFLAAVRHTYRRIAELPESGHPFGRRLRRALVPGFPYGLVYRIGDETIVIVAVAHLRRRPGYWQSRR